MAARKSKSTKSDRTELIEALEAIEKEKQISKDIILEAIENSLVEDPTAQIGLTEATLKYGKVELGDTVSTEVIPKNFGRIAAQKAKQVVVQKIREEERKVLYTQYLEKEREVITGIVQRYSGNNVCINLGKVDAILMES